MLCKWKECISIYSLLQGEMCTEALIRGPELSLPLWYSEQLQTLKKAAVIPDFNLR